MLFLPTRGYKEHRKRSSYAKDMIFRSRSAKLRNLREVDDVAASEPLLADQGFASDHAK